MNLGADDFAKFHEAVHGGRSPFDWQVRLLRQIVSEKKWPRFLDLPTGAGKTTCIDIAVFALALDAVEKERWCPLRIAMVVDRRVVVDQVAERGRLLLAALVRPDENPVVREVAERLRKLNREGREPLAVFTLRGGMPKDDTWARTPDQALVLASTVDQLGSRLVVQGYGVSQSMKPVHAGLLGNDTLVLLDEVHLSQPFAETLDQLDRLRQRANSTGVVDSRFHHAFLSATPGATAEGAFRLEEQEKAETSALGPRLHAKKPVRIRDAADRNAVEEACIDLALDLARRHDVVAVVMNRVASAASVAQRLGKHPANISDVKLLTGRMRPLDRDDAVRELRPRIAAGRERRDADRKLIVVGTQCIEAGADFDFDAMISEAASLDAVRQRFGRVDRLGTYGKAEGFIVVDKSAKTDPIYGESLTATVKWLKEHSHKKTGIDLGVLAMPQPSDEEWPKLLAPKEHAPVLLPAYLDLWMQTSPAPGAVPDVSLWLHGPRSGPADVQIVWRADLREEDLRAAQIDGDASGAISIVAGIRPSSLESMSVPFAAAQRWLSRAPASDIYDIEGLDSAHEEGRAEGLALRWRGDDSEVIGPRKLHPGDTIVVPAVRGGIRDKTFDPDGTGLVADLAERAALVGRGRPMLRLHSAVVANWKLPIAVDALDDAGDARAAIGVLAEGRAPGWEKLWLSTLAKGARSSVVDAGAGNRWEVLEGKRVGFAELRATLSVGETAEDGVELTTDEDDSFHAGAPVTLADHSGDVEKFARSYATAVGLPRAVVEDVALAGWLHDIGKADRRFQVLLRGGSEIDFYKAPTVWAKSGMSPGANAAHRIAQRRSGYPKGARHEVQSVAMVEKHIDAVRAKATDLDLVLHLVGSHHGHCRPFAPPVEDPAPVEVVLPEHGSGVFGSLNFGPTSSDHGLHRLDSPIADRFWGLVEKYGWLELCWLEAILRLADHRASEEEQGGRE